MAGRGSSPRRDRQRGGHAPTADAVDALGGGGLDGFWVRLDADVLDPSVMPTVDSPDPDGTDGALPADLVIDALGGV